MKKFDLNFTVCLFLIVFLPEFVFVNFHQSSDAMGLFIGSILILFLNYNYLIKLKIHLRYFLFTLIAFSFIFAESSISYIFANESKPIDSLLPFLLIVLSGFVLSRRLITLNLPEITNAFLVIIIYLLALGWIKILKPSFFFVFFSEPSHYILMLGIITVAYTLISKKIPLFIIFINFLIFSIFLPSLESLVFAFLVLFVGSLRLKLRYLLIIFLIILVLLPILTSWILSFDYFKSRLNFETKSNLTTLVFIQGWQLAYKNFIDTNGLGLGFQMLGLSGTHYPSATRTILRLQHGDGGFLNTEDGGFIDSKLIAEFGFIGIIISLIYIVFLVKFIIKTNLVLTSLKHNLNNKKYYQIKKSIILNGIIFGFLVEFFFRGIGYFSGGVYLVLLVLFYKIQSF
ncbi:MAG: hypothetical protein QXV17_13775 [Candidatus Micrarchaeaceae archaeon]